jgi:cytochrome P450
VSTFADSIQLSDLESDPDPILQRLRQESPVAYLPALEMWFVTRWDDLVYVEEHAELFTAATEPSFLARTLGSNMLTLDPPESSRIRNAMIGSFQPGGMSGEYVKTRLEDLANHFLSDFVDAGQVELMGAFAAPLSAASLADVLGIADYGWEAIWGWCCGVCADLANFENDPELEAKGSAAKAELETVLTERINQLRDAPGSGAISDFVQADADGRPLSNSEIINNVRLMISGGINEPRDGIGLVVMTLLQHPETLSEVLAEPRLWRRAVEETFRLHSPVGTITRQATQDLEIAGVAIPAGDLVSGILHSANLDEEHWKNPATFDIHRREGGHAAFALGPHRCLGEWLGRQEVRVGAQTVFENLPNLRLTAEPVVSGFEFRGPPELHLAWS